jgi:cell division protein FtsB
MRVHPIFTNKVFFAAAIVVLIVFVVLDAKQYQAHKEVNDEIRSLQQQESQLNQQNNDLQNLVTNWQADAPDNTDKAAREQLNLQKPGETVYSFAPQANDVAQNAAAVAAANPSPDQSGASNAHKWWDYFFHNN